MVVGWSTVCFGLDVIIFGCLPFAYSEPSFADGPAAYPVPVQNTKPLLTVSFTSGDISLMNNYDDLSPTIIRSGLKGTRRSHFFPFLCPVFLVFLMMCAWVIFLWLSLLNPGALGAVIAVSSSDTCWRKSSSWLMEFLCLKKCFTVFLRSYFYGTFVEQLMCFAVFQQNTWIWLCFFVWMSLLRNTFFACLIHKVFHAFGNLV